MMIHGIQISAETDIGLLRENNEDSYLIVDHSTAACDVHRFGYLFVVADGMGGHAAGEVASRMACDAMRSYYAFDTEDDKDNSPVPPETAHRFLERAIRLANHRIYRSSRANRYRRGMGTTLSALVICENDAVIGHVGDSRIYRFRGDLLEQLTEDQTEVQSMIADGYLSKEAAAKHPFRHLLLQAVGSSETLKSVYTWMGKVNPGDIYLLSSDGLHDMMPDSEIKALLLSSKDARTACHELIRQAVHSGGRDNVTAVVVRILSEQRSEHG